MEPVRFLFVDDDEQILRALSRILSREGHELHFEQDPLLTLARVEEWRVEVLVCDHMMPGITGVRVLSDVKERFPKVLRVLASGSQDRPETEGIADSFLDKPWFGDDLKSAMQDLARTAVARRAP